jgi:hypothetical protein
MECSGQGTHEPAGAAPMLRSSSSAVIIRPGGTAVAGPEGRLPAELAPAASCAKDIFMPPELAKPPMLLAILLPLLPTLLASPGGAAGTAAPVEGTRLDRGEAACCACGDACC